MPRLIKAYVRCCDSVTRAFGIFAEFLIIAITGVLLFNSISSALDHPQTWAVETGQFIFTAYYFLGGAYVILLRGHVRMDVFYTKWSPRNQGRIDVITDFFFLFYLIFLLVGGIEATSYAIMFDQVRRSIWAPIMWPIKAVMCVGIVLMILQLVSTLFKDIAKAREVEIYTEEEKALADSRGEVGISGGKDQI